MRVCLLWTFYMLFCLLTDEDDDNIFKYLPTFFFPERGNPTAPKGAGCHDQWAWCRSRGTGRAEEEVRRVVKEAGRSWWKEGKLAEEGESVRKCVCQDRLGRWMGMNGIDLLFGGLYLLDNWNMKFCNEDLTNNSYMISIMIINNDK